MAEIDSTNTCKSCRFYVTGNLLGQCRRFPTFMNRHQNEWCGEHAEEIFVSDYAPLAVKFVDRQNEPKKRGRPRKL